MDDQNMKILHELITKGTYTVYHPYDLTLLNSHLRTLNCVAKEWYDKSLLILVQETNRKDKNDMAVMKLFIKNQINASVRERLPFLIENGWIENNELSKKFIMQYKNFIVENSDDYYECEVCKILVKDGNIHQYCEEKRNDVVRQINTVHEKQL